MSWSLKLDRYHLESNLPWTKQLLESAKRLIAGNLIGEDQIAKNDLPISFASHSGLAILPLAMLYHDQPAALQATLLQHGTAEQEVSGDRAEAAILAQVISLLLREQRPPAQLIPQVLQDLSLPAQNLALLHQVQSWLEHPTDLAAITSWLTSSVAEDVLPQMPLALGLYCFLSTAPEFRLSLLRLVQFSRPLIQASRLPQSSLPFMAAMTGALSGMYNGVAGLPLGSQVQQTESSLSTAEIGAISTQLLALWSGASDSTGWFHQPHLTLTAAPRVIKR
jgi:hypothetical protein